MNLYLRLFRLALTSGLLALGFAGCSQGSLDELAPRPAEEEAEETGKVTVRVAVPMEVSRTEIEENGTVTRWSPGDRIALWALQGGSYALEAQPFDLWHFGMEYPTAWFTAQIAPMAEGTHTYYAAYPVPDAVSGTVAEYELPVLQNGTADLSHAVMVARPAEGEALTTAGAEELHLDFVHKLHVLKITVPENKNLLGEPISRLEIDFSQPVVGRLLVDVSDAGAPVALDDNNSSSVLTLEFPAPVDAGTPVYAVIAPVDLTGHTISFKAYSERLESKTVTTFGKDFAAGHTTPIRLTIPAQLNKTKFYFTIGTNYLGEAPETFTVRFTDGTPFPGGEDAVTFAAADADAEGRYEYNYTGDFDTDYSGKEFEVVFESAHARVRKNFTMPAVERYASTTVAPLEVPYLFFEEFSTVGEFGVSEWKDNDKKAEGNAVELTSGFLRTGWTGTQVFSSAGASVTLKDRHEGTRIAAGDYRGRLDSAPMTDAEGYGLKSGASVAVSVSFDYSCSSHGTTYDNYKVYMTFGSTTKSGPIAAFYHTTRDHNEDGKVSGEEKQLTDGGSGTQSYRIEGCGSAHRLSWDVFATGNSGWTPHSCNYYLTLDNIRVSIAQ